MFVWRATFVYPPQATGLYVTIVSYWKFSQTIQNNDRDDDCQISPGFAFDTRISPIGWEMSYAMRKVWGNTGEFDFKFTLSLWMPKAVKRNPISSMRLALVWLMLAAMKTMNSVWDLLLMFSAERSCILTVPAYQISHNNSKIKVNNIFCTHCELCRFLITDWALRLKSNCFPCLYF